MQPIQPSDALQRGLQRTMRSACAPSACTPVYAAQRAGGRPKRAVASPHRAPQRWQARLRGSRHFRLRCRRNTTNVTPAAAMRRQLAVPDAPRGGTRRRDVASTYHAATAPAGRRGGLDAPSAASSQGGTRDKQFSAAPAARRGSQRCAKRAARTACLTTTSGRQKTRQRGRCAGARKRIADAKRRPEVTKAVTAAVRRV